MFLQRAFLLARGMTSLARTMIIAAFGKQFEPQCSRCGDRLDELDLDPVAQSMRLTGAFADKGVQLLFVAKEVFAERPCRDETVRARVVELHEQAGARDAG